MQDCCNGGDLRANAFSEILENLLELYRNYCFGLVTIVIIIFITYGVWKQNRTIKNIKRE